MTDPLVRLASQVIPSAFALLPSAMASREAAALLIAIAAQESNAIHRRQHGDGPARGLWQFERPGGVRGVLRHEAVRGAVRAVLHALGYPVSERAVHLALERDDVLAACLARCLLWTLPGALPGADEPDRGWSQYLKAWRPGKPRPETWAEHFRLAWSVMT